MKITKDHLPWFERLFWQCPKCLSINAWNWEDAERFIKRTGEGCHVSTGSCFDNICGNPKCRADIVKPDSPILAPCYTHLEA